MYVYSYMKYTVLYIYIYTYSKVPDMQVLRGNPASLRTCGYYAEIPKMLRTCMYCAEFLQDSGHAGTGHAGTARKSSKAPDMQVLTDRDTHTQTPRDTRGRQSVLVNANARTTTDWGMCPNSDPKSYLYWYDKVPVQVWFRALSGFPNREEAGETFEISTEPEAAFACGAREGQSAPPTGEHSDPHRHQPRSQGAPRPIQPGLSAQRTIGVNPALRGQGPWQAPDPRRPRFMKSHQPPDS